MGCLIYMPLILPLDADKKKISLGLWSISWAKNECTKNVFLWRSEDMLLLASNVQLYPKPQELM